MNTAVFSGEPITACRSSCQSLQQPAVTRTASQQCSTDCVRPRVCARTRSAWLFSLRSVMSCFHHILPQKNLLDRTFDPERGSKTHAMEAVKQEKLAAPKSPQLRKDKLYTVTMTAEQCCWKCGWKTKVSSNEAPTGFPLTSPGGVNTQRSLRPFFFCLPSSACWLWQI